MRWDVDDHVARPDMSADVGCEADVDIHVDGSIDLWLLSALAMIPIGTVQAGRGRVERHSGRRIMEVIYLSGVILLPLSRSAPSLSVPQVKILGQLVAQ